MKFRILTLFIVLINCLHSQNETAKWYFGAYAGLDFMTSPPTALSNGTMLASFGSASVADASGNLLFYTNGVTVWDASHAPMANGTGLLGVQSGAQPALIVKQPGTSSIYYIFTTKPTATPGFHYSIVDMSLSAGAGSVTVKNTPLYTGYVGGKLTGTRHCNGVDYWIVVRDYNSSTWQRNFRAYQFGAAGVNTVAVVSTASTWSNNVNYYDQYGAMKISPNGKKLALANYYNWQNTHSYELWDFDNSTGAVTNSLALGAMTFTNNIYYYGGWGVEFSPDATKLYGSRINNYNNWYGGIMQWDLCAGSGTAIVASESVIATSTTSTNSWHGDMQIAKDGKIYIANYYNNNTQAISVINSPNQLGAACNYSHLAQSVSPKNSTYGLPNFIGSHFVQPPPVSPFTHTVSNSFGCQGVGFTSPVTPNTTVSACSAVGYSLTNLLWSFGDPASGALNTTTVTNPVHAFTSLGSYTVQLILYYSCGGGTDTLRQTVNVNMPCISVTSSSITCASLGSATVVSTGGVGPFSFTWMPSGQTNSVATGLSPGTYTLTVFDFGTNFTYTATTMFTSLIPLTGNISTSSTLACNGVNTGTGSVTNLAGGSGNENFLWANGINSYTTANVSTLSAGLWSISVTDALTGCAINDLFFITQPSASTLQLAYSSPTACVGTQIVLTGTNSGGSPAYTYTWTGGPASDTKTVTALTGGTYIYTLNSKDSLNCLTTKTISVGFVDNPVLSVANVSICPLQTGTLSITGASTYTWSDNSTGNTFTANPVSTSHYSVVGTALGCTTAASASVILKPVPVPLIGSNSPVCNGRAINLFANGGVSYQWSGPLSFNSNNQNPVITNGSLGHNGVYNVTVTAANSCTAPTSLTFVVNPTPTITAAGSTVCTNQALNLTSASFNGSSYSWTGPGGFISSQQNPQVNNPPVSSSGIYTVKATSAAGCTIDAVAHVTVTQLPVLNFITNSPRCLGTNLSLDASATTGGSGFSWSGPNGFNSNAVSPSVNNVSLLAGGVYSLTVTRGPCTTGAAQAVIVNPLPSPTASSNPLICALKTISLSVNNSNYKNFDWAGPNGFIRSVQEPIIPNAGSPNSGTYTVTVTDQNDCVNSATISISILPNPTVSALGTTVCRFQPATVTATGADYYYWTGPYLSVNNLSAAVIGEANNASPTSYYVVGTAANTCTDTAIAIVNTRDLPVPAITASKNRVCMNGLVSFEGSGGSYYYWNGPEGITGTGKTFTFAPGSPAHSGMYTLTVSDNIGCKGSTSTSLTVDGLPVGFLTGTKMEGCAPFSADFKFGSSVAASSLITSSWQVMNKSFTGKEFSFRFVNPGQHVVTGYFTDTVRNCVNTMTFAVTVHPRPVAEFAYEPAKPVENTEHVIFTDQSEGGEITEWNWNFAPIEPGGSTYVSTSESASFFYPEAGTYPVALVVSNTWGCMDTVLKFIKVDPDFHVWVPNAFSPNNDRQNEVFAPVGNGIKKFRMVVLNRWGNKMFETTDLQSGWDGTYNGQLCAAGVYSWKIYVTSLNGEAKELTGHVTLLK